jgi:hypothetical protein
MSGGPSKIYFRNNGVNFSHVRPICGGVDMSVASPTSRTDVLLSLIYFHPESRVSIQCVFSGVLQKAWFIDEFLPLCFWNKSFVAGYVHLHNSHLCRWNNLLWSVPLPTCWISWGFNTVLGAYFLPTAMYFAKKPISKHIILITSDLITAALLCLCYVMLCYVMLYYARHVMLGYVTLC